MAQMPGEARGYQFAPQQAAGVPAAMVNNFKQIRDMRTLLALHAREPSIPLLAHIDEVRKELRMKQAAANGLAMQQAQQQGPQTLNDQILAGAEQVAGMSPVRRMAAGGIVALSGGGLGKSASEISDQELFQAYRGRGGLGYASALLGERPEGRNSPAQQAWDANKRALDARLPAVIQAQGRQPVPAAAASTPAAAPVDVLQQAFSPDAQQGRVAEGLSRRAAAAGAVPETVTPNATRSAAGTGTGTGTGAGTTSTIRNRGVDTTVEKPRQEPRQEPPPAAEALAAPAAVTQALNALVAASTTPTEVPQALREQRTKVAGIQELMTQQALDEATRARNALDREHTRREGRLNKPFLEGDMLPLLASFLSAKKGEFFPSLARGLAAVSTEEEKARKDLAQYRTTEGERVRQLNNTYRQLQLEQAKYELARSEGDLKTARESSEKIAQLRYNAAVKTEELKNDRIRADAALANARAAGISAGAQAAAVPSRIDAATQGATTRLAAVLNNDPILQGYRKRLEGGLISPEDEAALLTKMRAREKELRLQYAPELAALGQAAGAGAGSSARSAADAILEGNR